MLTSCTLSHSLKLRHLRAPKTRPALTGRRIARAYTTPTKASLKEPMAPSYDPKAVESEWTAYFKPTGDGPKYSMVLPPPNVTGSLHIGHALTIAIEDSVARYKRMQGYKVLHVPGLDHAGIGTQTVVEKYLFKTFQLTRRDLTKTQLLEHIYEWKNKFANTIVGQLKRTGASMDWSREVFTLDENLSKAVLEAFVQLHEAGLIYRSTRLVNWCCHLQTVISDIEVDYLELTGPTNVKVPGSKKKLEMGVIHYLMYPVEGVDQSGWLKVATTRPETIYGDTAIAVHPDDQRYTSYHNKFAINPLTGTRIPIITDAELVDMETGTGVVKVTPAHDPSDYACGQRNNLQFLSILNEDGTMNKNAGECSGVSRFESRLKVLQILKDKNLFVETKPHPMRVGVCSKSGDILEPILMPQWYVKCKSLAENAIALVESGQITIKPDSFKDEWFRWLGNIHDWCISRQLWWGHAIPAYRIISDAISEEEWVIARSLEEAQQKVVDKYGSIQFTLKQDEDVLDTWFSSGLFPLSALGWPHKEVDEFYPLDLMETGHDILFFWVARMVMLCTFLAKKKPFNHVLLHGLVRDAHGRKMSKSLGNVIDPNHVIQGITLDLLKENLLKGNLDPSEVQKASAGLEKDFPKGIPECGADALRYTLLQYTKQERAMNLEVSKIQANRFLGNKIWNATRLALQWFDEVRPTGLDMTLVAKQAELIARNGQYDSNSIQVGELTYDLMDFWVLSRLAKTVQTVNAALEAHQFSDALEAIQCFFMYEFTAVYLEFAKFVFYSDAAANRKQGTSEVVFYSLDTTYRLIHPFMPFITEELWQRLHLHTHVAMHTDTIMMAKYPTTDATQAFQNDRLEYLIAQLNEVVNSLRSVKKNYAVGKEDKLDLLVNSNEADVKAVIQFFERVLASSTFGGVASITHTTVDPPPNERLITRVLQANLSIAIQLPPTAAPSEEATAKELTKITNEMTQLTTQIEKLTQQMSGDNYTQKVNVKVQEKNAKKLQDWQTKLAELQKTAEKLGGGV